MRMTPWAGRRARRCPVRRRVSPPRRPRTPTEADCYYQETSVDANSHKTDTLTDALAQQAYARSYTGNSGASYALYSTVRYTNDYLGHLVKILHPGGSTATTYQYDMAGRE